MVRPPSPATLFGLDCIRMSLIPFLDGDHFID